MKQQTFPSCWVSPIQPYIFGDAVFQYTDTSEGLDVFKQNLWEGLNSLSECLGYVCDQVEAKLLAT
jgi:hypothetical protein